MSKTVKNIIMRDYKGRLAASEGGLRDAMVISIRGLKGKDATKLRHTLSKKNIRITVIRNSLGKAAFRDTSLEPLAELLTGSSALAYGGQSVVEVAREIIGAIGGMPAVELKGAILDGTLFKGKAGCEELSKFPTREEAVAQNVTLIVSPGRKLSAQVQGPGSKVAGLIKAIEEKLEKGEAIAKVA